MQPRQGRSVDGRSCGHFEPACRQAHDLAALALRANGLPLAGALRLAAAAAAATDAALPGEFSGCSPAGFRAKGLPPAPPAAAPGRARGEGARLALPAVAAAGLGWWASVKVGPGTGVMAPCCRQAVVHGTGQAASR